MVQEWGGEDGLWHSKCLEDIWHQQQVQVDAAFFQDTAFVLISELQLEDGSHPLLSLANNTSQYVLNSGWLCYCTPWVLNPGQIRGWPRIRCLQTETFVEPSQSFGVPSPCLTLLFVPFCTARLCPSYPQQLLVPAWITDKELENVAAFRSWKRFPAVVYRFVYFFRSYSKQTLGLFIIREVKSFLMQRKQSNCWIKSWLFYISATNPPSFWFIYFFV